MVSAMAGSEHADELKVVTLNTFLHVVLDDKVRTRMNRSFSDSDLSSTTDLSSSPNYAESAGEWKEGDHSSERSADQSSEHENKVDLQAYLKLSPEELAPLLPEDSGGNAASIGSIAHDDGSCSPCSFFARTRGCREGMYCQFCHLGHAKEKKHRHRPCKGQRLHFSRTLDRLKAGAEDDPDGFNLDHVELPPSIAGHGKWRNKMIQKLSQHISDLKDTP